jgi:hypothetical protein
MVLTGNQSTWPIGRNLMVQAVGPIPGVVPTATRNQVQQTTQGKSAPILLAAPLTPIQGPEDNPVARRLRDHPRQ